MSDSNRFHNFNKQSDRESVFYKASRQTVD